MESELLEKRFREMGSRIKLHSLRAKRPVGYELNIGHDAHGEYFDLALSPRAPEMRVLQVLPKERHLLLYTADGSRFLCGHDERHWFVAPIAKAVSTVRAAKLALLPPAVWEQVKNVSPGELDVRRNAVFKRQGEWFFLPTNRTFIRPVIHKKEPIQRTARSKPHICEELIRLGGKLVYIVNNKQYSREEFEGRKKSDPRFGSQGYRTMVANPEVYVRGSVRHADHATIELEGWHRVFINAELTMSEVAFLD